MPGPGWPMMLTERVRNPLKERVSGAVLHAAAKELTVGLIALRRPYERAVVEDVAQRVVIAALSAELRTAERDRYDQRLHESYEPSQLDDT